MCVALTAWGCAPTPSQYGAGNDGAANVEGMEAGSGTVDLSGSYDCGENASCASGQICVQVGCADGAPACDRLDAGEGRVFSVDGGFGFGPCCSDRVLYGCVDAPPACGSAPTCACLTHEFAAGSRFTYCEGRTFVDNFY